MKIVLVPNVFWPLFGGVVTSVDTIARYFVESGHEVAVIVHRTEPQLLPYERRNGFEIYRVEFSTKNRLRRAWVFLQALTQMYRLLRRLRPDIVSVQILHINMLYPLILSYVMSYKLILRAGGNDIHKFPKESRLLKYMLMWGFRRAHQIQFNSNNLREDAVRYLPLSPREIRVVGDGADPEEFLGITPYVPADGRPYIFTMGRFVYKKGFDLLIRAFAAVVAEDSSVQLIIAGDGEEMAALKLLVAELHLEKNVSLVGFVEREALGAYLRGCLFFVLPSRIEPVGIVTLEAMSLAKPVLASRVGGVLDIVQHGKSGWTVEPNSTALAEGMLHLLRHPEIRRDLAENGRQRMLAHFTWRKIANDHLEAFDRALGA